MTSRADYGSGGRLLAKAVRDAYNEGHIDYSMEPLVLTDADGKPVGKVSDGDGVIFCCRRGEREIELTDAFIQQDYPHFERRLLKNLDFVILTMYHEKFKHLPIAFAPSRVDQTLAECVSAAGLRQLHCAESEKYAHVTYFFNGGRSEPFPGETDVCVPSPKGVPFDTVPELSLPAVAGEISKGLERDYDFIVANLANGDVIGHTSSSEAKVLCAASLDRYLGGILAAARERDYVTIITADHGNLETLLNAQGQPHVAHTCNPVPLLIIDPRAEKPLAPSDGILGNIAPTALQILGLPKPEGMTRESLLPGYDFGKGRKLLLLVLDGWGIGADGEPNPLHTADTPVWDELEAKHHRALLGASGEDVGLARGKAGNSEAGHINLGAGRVVTQDDVRLNAAMEDGSFSKNPVFLDTIRRVKQRGGALHLLALLTKKSSHGSIDYPLALLKMAKSEGLEDVFIHIILDGRSTEPGSAPALLEELDDTLSQIGAGLIVDGVGRGVALDRDNNFAKIKKAYECFALGAGRAYSL